MKRNLFLFLILGVLIYEVFNIVTKRKLSTGPQYNKLFKTQNKNENTISKSIISNKRTQEIWEKYNRMTLDFSQQNDFIKSINELSNKIGLTQIQIKPKKLKEDKSLLIFPVNIEIEADYNKIYNFVKAIENIPLFIRVENLSIQHKNNLNAKILIHVQVMKSKEERFCEVSKKTLSLTILNTPQSSLKDPFVQ
ncbi:MAG: type 4a pilus biogenesis protein PilO [Candidatus Firestonebacteria bacterium]|nr:type 4a pilus biogenesis protein PilO [Candidatus Firestonebacteria bacterium]